MARIDYPANQPGATEFSDDRLGPLWLVREFKRSKFGKPLVKACKKKVEKNWGRKREPGDWVIVFMAFAANKKVVDVEPWWIDHASDELWHACGFAAKPSYATVYLRFVELEQCIGEIVDCAGSIVSFARKHEPRIGRHVHVDSAEAETHAAFLHDCQPGEGCPGWSNVKPLPPRLRKLTAGAVRPGRRSTDAVREDRLAAAEKAPPDDHQEVPGRPERVEITDGRLRVKCGKHWYRTLDHTAGARAYTGGRGSYKFWSGFYNMKAIDHFTGAPLAVGVYAANVQEYYCFPRLYRMLRRVLAGDDPQTVVTDRGFGVNFVYRFLTRRGVAHISPWRPGGFNPEPDDHESHDRHGVPRCKYCGGETVFVRFHKNGGKPRLWFRCQMPLPGCCKVDGKTPKEQTILCEKDWRLLRPCGRPTRSSRTCSRAMTATSASTVTGANATASEATTSTHAPSDAAPTGSS